jgi:hypothetical protein
LIVRLRRVLHEMWLTEYAWQSIEIFAPIYDLVCEMMALHGLAFANMRTSGISSCAKMKPNEDHPRCPGGLDHPTREIRELIFSDNMGLDG